LERPHQLQQGIADVSDRRFYIVLTTLLLGLAAAEIAYGVFGPLSVPPQRIDELSSINRAR
jgi:hypothetical protein